MPSISIVIPTHNRAHLVSRALDSCFKQSIPDLEVIVVDDGSTDNTADVIDSYPHPIRYLCMEHNLGAHVARNKGLAAASGQYIKFLDSDDVLELGSLVQEWKLANSEQADIVVSGWGIEQAGGNLRVVEPPEFSEGEALIDDVLDGKGVHTSAAFYRLAYLRATEAEWHPKIVKLDDWYFFAHAVLGLGKVVRRESLCYWMLAHEGPRLTDASMLENAISHHLILDSFAARLSAMGKFSAERRKRLAIYYFKELQVLALYDWKRVAPALQTIRQLDPEVDPYDGFTSKALARLASLIGIKNALRCYKVAKR